MLAIFDEKIEIRERCKGVHCVDLGESFPTGIYLQKSASIQPRTSLSKFGGKFNSLFIRLLRANYRLDETNRLKSDLYNFGALVLGCIDADLRSGPSNEVQPSQLRTSN